MKYSIIKLTHRNIDNVIFPLNTEYKFTLIYYGNKDIAYAILETDRDNNITRPIKGSTFKEIFKAIESVFQLAPGKYVNNYKGSDDLEIEILDDNNKKITWSNEQSRCVQNHVNRSNVPKVNKEKYEHITGVLMSVMRLIFNK
jgi:hypothetical protein